MRRKKKERRMKSLKGVNCGTLSTGRWESAWSIIGSICLSRQSWRRLTPTADFTTGKECRKKAGLQLTQKWKCKILPEGHIG